MLLGVIADDLTGATDVALMLAREGMRVIQTVGVPASAAALPDADAVVVSMKSRTNPAAEAVEWSLLRPAMPFSVPARGRSCSNIVPPSIPQMQAISAPSRRR